MNIIDKTIARSKKCFGANPLGWDRLFVNGNNEQAAFFAALARERQEMTEALNVAATTMQVMDAELNEIKAAVIANGVASMELGAKRSEVE